METNNQAGVQPKAKVPTRITILKNALSAESVQEQFKNALKENSGAFIASVIDLYNNDSQLQICDPNKVITEALKAAVMKLPINKALGFAYLLVFNNSVKEKFTDDKGIQRERWIKVPTPTFVPGYKGYIQMAMRTGQYRTINADFVYEGELRKVNKLSGEIAFDGEQKSDKIVGYFCYFELLNGFSKTLYMTVEAMAGYAKQYSPGLKLKNDVTKDSLLQLANSQDSNGKVGWIGNFNDMALKTVIRQLLSKYGYLSTDMQNAVAGDREPDNERDQLIADHGNSQTVNIQDVSFEAIGESSPAPAPEKEEDGPNY